MANGSNGATVVDSVESNLKSNFMPMLSDMLKEIRDADLKAAAAFIGQAKDPEELAHRVQRLMAGNWTDQALVHGAAIGGLAAGHAAGSRLRWSLGPVPLIGVLGLGGLISSLFAHTLAGRAALSLGGVMFGAGAFMGARSCSK